MAKDTLDSLLRNQEKHSENQKGKEAVFPGFEVQKTPSETVELRDPDPAYSGAGGAKLLERDKVFLSFMGKTAAGEPVNISANAGEGIP